VIEIPLVTPGFIALVDDEDADLALSRWTGVKRRYAKRYLGRPGGIQRWELMHRVILQRKLGRSIIGETDHINGNGLDNRRDNIREASNTENNWNARKRRHLCLSLYKGVSRDPRNSYRPWLAYIQVAQRRCHLGYFATEEEAAMAYNRAAVEHFGEYARPNVIANRPQEPVL
jgi:hypothetical protein